MQRETETETRDEEGGRAGTPTTRVMRETEVGARPARRRDTRDEERRGERKRGD